MVCAISLSLGGGGGDDLVAYLNRICEVSNPGNIVSASNSAEFSS